LQIDQRERHLAIIRSNDTRAAFLELLTGIARLELTPSANTGKVPAVRFHDRFGRYLFSCITNPHHLLFYIRRPAIAAAPHMVPQAKAHLQRVSVNPAGEITVRIEGIADAQKLLEWMNAHLPLAQ
jgi:hypothetical protein